MSTKKVIELREKVDILDSNLVKILEKRVALGKDIINLKKELGLKKVDSKREQKIVATLSKKSSFDKKTIGKFYKIIFKTVKSE